MNRNALLGGEASVRLDASKGLACALSVPEDGERQGLPTKVRLVSTPILTVERGSPVIDTGRCEVRVLTVK